MAIFIDLYESLLSGAFLLILLCFNQHLINIAWINFCNWCVTIVQHRDDLDRQTAYCSWVCVFYLTTNVDDIGLLGSFWGYGAGMSARIRAKVPSNELHCMCVRVSFLVTISHINHGVVSNNA